MSDETFGEKAYEASERALDETSTWSDLSSDRQAQIDAIDLALRDHVRAVLGPLLREPTTAVEYVEDLGRETSVTTTYATQNAAIHTAARALLGLPADAQSPLEDPQ